MTRILLTYGADVNALDWAGHTPLDICASHFGNVLTDSDYISPIEACYTATLLTQARGCLSKEGYDLFHARDDIRTEFAKSGGYYATFFRLLENAGVLSDTSAVTKINTVTRPGWITPSSPALAPSGGPEGSALRRLFHGRKSREKSDA